jgi:hypothetical protein
MNIGVYEETVKSNQSTSVSQYVLDPTYKSLYNQHACQQTPPGFSCISTHEKFDNIDNETALLRGTRSYGVIQKPTVKPVMNMPQIDKNASQLPFGNDFITRQHKSVKSISLLQNNRYLNEFPEHHNNLQQNTPLTDTYALFGLDTRQAIKYPS